MKQDFPILKTLKLQDFSNIDIDQIVNHLETLDYDMKNTKYIGKIIAKNERLAKYFFLRDRLKLELNSSEENFHIHEILDQCIEWNEFWRLLVIKKGFCCIKLAGFFSNGIRFIFLSGPNILTGASADLSNSIFEDMDY